MKRITFLICVLALLACNKESMNPQEEPLKPQNYPVQFEFHNQSTNPLARVEFLTFIQYQHDKVKSGIHSSKLDLESMGNISLTMNGSEIESIVRDQDLAWANIYIWQQREDGLFDESVWIPQTKTVNKDDSNSRLYQFNWPTDTIHAKLYSRKTKQSTFDIYRSYPGYRYEQLH